MSLSPLFPLSAAPLNRLLPFLASPANSNENSHQKQPPFPIRRKHARIHSCVDYLCIYSLDGIYLAQKRRILLGEAALRITPEPTKVRSDQYFIVPYKYH